MSKGYVYILKNPSMPGLLKIGKTTRSVEQRCHELWQTGVPTPFEVVEEVCTPNCHELEAWMHSHFKDHRVTVSREFFTCDHRECVDQLRLFQMEQMRLLLDEFLPDHDIVEVGMSVGPAEIFMLSDELDTHPFEVTAAMEFLTADELRPALDRYRDRIRLRQEARAQGNEMPPIHDWRAGPIQ